LSRVWLRPLLDSVADHGRELLGLKAGTHFKPDCTEICESLLGERGIASGLALAREVLIGYQGMTSDERSAFFRVLLDRFGVDLVALEEAARTCRAAPTPACLKRLLVLSEPKRQELFRRLNAAPGGTAALVHMRSDLLQLIRIHPELEPVDFDLQHLLGSWFNPGFLQLERIDWDSPARMLEKLIAYESVHAIRGWDDLRRRLKRDRRCFAFFHPALEGEPLIFVEVALVRGLAKEIAPLVDPDAPETDPQEADTAIFYSINNTQAGLRGIAFGNFLIKRVVQELMEELPHLRAFATLSPLPHFANTMKKALSGGVPGLEPARLDRLLAEWAEPLKARVPAAVGPAAAAMELAERHADEDAALLGPVLLRLALAYLTTPAHRRGGSRDPVARFHLTNGARLERINPLADDSPRGRELAFGVMVNYVYDPAALEVNNERFVQGGEIPLSKALGKDLRKLGEQSQNSAPTHH
jgi:malonyl-CoA decarboxylase